MKKILLLTSLLFTTILFAQTGPGGVGTTDGTSNLEFWYDANHEIYSNGNLVPSMLDLSGNGNNSSAIGSEQPVFTTTTLAINNASSILFDGNDELEASHIGNSNENMSLGVVFNSTNTENNNDVIIQHGGRNTFGIKHNEKYFDYIGGTNHNGITYTTGAWVIHTKTIANTGVHRLKFFENGTNTNSFNHNIENRTSNTWIGGNGTGGGTGLNGGIAETYKFSRVLNTTERIIIDNYLSAKYNLALASGDFYTQDDSSNGDFDHNVAGIGQETATDNHTDSQGTGIVKINNPTDLNDNEYLFWGEETKNPTYDFTMSSNYTERLNSKWRISEQGGIDRVDIAVKASDLDLTGKESCASLQLIVSNTSDFAVNIAYDMSLSTGVYTVTSVPLNDGDYFTFEYFNMIVVDDTQFYNGSGTNNVPSTTDSCYKLLVKASATGALTLTEDAVVKEIEVETGGVLIVNDGLKLEVNEAIQLDGTIRLNGQSQLLQTHTGVSTNTGTGHLLIDQDGAKNAYRYNYWSSPVQNDAGGVFSLDTVLKDGTTPNQLTPTQVGFTTSPDGTNGSPITISTYWTWKYVDGDIDPYNDEGWTAIGNTGTVNPGEGFTMKGTDIGAVHGDKQNYSFEGKPNDGDYTLNISDDKEYLIGNPYPSALNVNLFLNDNSATIDGVIWFWEHWSTDTHVYTDYGGGYVVYAPASGATQATLHPDFVNGANAGTSGSITLPTNYRIPVGQGFIVRSSSASGGTITFKNSQRAFQPEGASSIFIKSDTPEETTTSRIRIGYEGPNGRHRFLLLALTEEGTANYDTGFDAEMIDVAEDEMFFTMEDDGRNLPYVIQGVTPYQYDASYPFTIKVATAGEHRIMIDAFENFEHTVYVFDKETNICYPINDSEFIVSLEAGDYTNRFEISFYDIATVGVSDYLNQLVGVSFVNNELTIHNENKEEITQLQVFNSFGQLVYQSDNKQILSEQRITFPFNYSKGAYILKVVANNGNGAFKFIN